MTVTLLLAKLWCFDRVCRPCLSHHAFYPVLRVDLSACGERMRYNASSIRHCSAGVQLRSGLFGSGLSCTINQSKTVIIKS